MVDYAEAEAMPWDAGVGSDGMKDECGPVSSWRVHNDDRIRRARSWLDHSNTVQTDQEKFVYLWISFNAAYGRDLSEGTGWAVKEQRRFFEEVLERDREKRILRLLTQTFSGPIRMLLENRFVYKPYWSSVRDTSLTFDQAKFERHNRAARWALMNGDCLGVLVEVFHRLYTLRNQVLHGGTTFGEGWGRDQLRDGCRILAATVPVILEIVEADIRQDPASTVWGRVDFPRHEV